MTTVVVQNLSGRYSREDVMQVWPIDGTYDYMHMPYNLLQKRPLGYVFFNFVTHELAVAFQQKWHGKVLPASGGRKALEVGPAEVQGRRGNLELIKSRKLGQMEKAGFLPLVWRGGALLDSKQIAEELAEIRSMKAKLSNAPRTRTAKPVRHLDLPILDKEDGPDDDSDAPTTATGGDSQTL